MDMPRRKLIYGPRIGLPVIEDKIGPMDKLFCIEPI